MGKTQILYEDAWEFLELANTSTRVPELIQEN